MVVYQLWLVIFKCVMKKTGAVLITLPTRISVNIIDDYKTNNNEVSFPFVIFPPCFCFFYIFLLSTQMSFREERGKYIDGWSPRWSPLVPAGPRWSDVWMADLHIGEMGIRRGRCVCMRSSRRHIDFLTTDKH